MSELQSWTPSYKHFWIRACYVQSVILQQTPLKLFKGVYQDEKVP